MNRLKFLFLFTFSSLLVSAQQVDFSGGFTFGGITSQVQGDGVKGFYKIGISGGAFIEVSTNDVTAIRGEILYSQKGSRNFVNYSQNNPGIPFALKFSYVEIPLYYQRKIRQVDVYGGLYAGVLLDASQLNGADETGDFNPELNTLDAGFLGGLSYDWNDNIYISIRYSQSILSVRPRPEGALTYYDGAFYNISSYLMLGYRFGAAD